jgi:peptidoglycan/LPS O-acetylase OafA/YrhL
MADLERSVPVEEVKADSLHDISNRPKRPTLSIQEHGMDWLIFAVGLIFAGAYVAAAFELRESWESHRDWVVPVFVPPLVAGGVAAAYLIIRQQWEAAIGGLFLVIAAAVLIGANLALDAEDDPSATAQDLTSAFGAVALGLSVAAFVFGMLWVEFRHPTRAPTPEM